VTAVTTHRLVFATGEYLGPAAFFPEVTIVFDVGGQEKLHVPLLLAPYGYSTYRGS
jgi:5-hydroxyisourate hydrolase